MSVKNTHIQLVSFKLLQLNQFKNFLAIYYGHFMFP